MGNYKHLFFDLDFTLWDFATNETSTLARLFEKYSLGSYFDDFNAFLFRYKAINTGLWFKYRAGDVKIGELKIKRFYNTLLAVGEENWHLAANLASDFAAINPTMTAVMPYTFEVLNYLYPRYQLNIITNGQGDVQRLKLEKSGLITYFNKVFISDEVGFSKPDQAFFEHAISSCNALKSQSLIIGDSIESDIKGAMNFNLDHVYFNPYRVVHDEQIFAEIHSLLELKLLL